ncbi:MAG TPA: 16S rRNA (guanine(966)-N(2))-methyltransferase RsmD [Gemmatimonadales bacterium]|jgi:16S rRNA (guanine966-N2)-methyltransferase|nr:16S rRNA (guanine(966)-N(2))-methyltransferase RsmD [Gemmatimonadales bacterium]
MRIVAGQFKGRRLAVPRDPRVRPTADRVREAWMNILQDALPGARVLDLYAGSGALGLEALSRGARTAEFVEINPACLAALRANVAALGVAPLVAVHRAHALRFAERLPPASYDVCFADPPYDRDDADRLVALFRQTPFARILTVEHPARRDLPGDETRRYGTTALTFCYAP